jgi:hypothetical protein
VCLKAVGDMAKVTEALKRHMPEHDRMKAASVAVNRGVYLSSIRDRMRDVPRDA